MRQKQKYPFFARDMAAFFVNLSMQQLKKD
jgi:hypothetical protein